MVVAVTKPLMASDETASGGLAGDGPPRFEFRVWSEAIEEAARRLRAMSAPTEVRDTLETYLISTRTIRSNAKERDDLLDIKVLVAEQDGFEQWSVYLKAAFPLEAELLRSELFPALGVEAPQLDRPAYTKTELLGDVVAAHEDVEAVEVAKHRELFEVDACLGEIASVEMLGRSLQTMAVESTDLAALTILRRDLGIDGRSNVSYSRAIRDVLGGHFALQRGASDGD